MEHIDNSPQKIAIRKYQNNLIVVGSGIILFGIWTAVKLIASIFMLKDETLEALKGLMGADAGGIPDSFILGVILAIVFIILGIDLLMRTYVGLSAIAEGRGRRRGSVYLWMSGLMAVGSLLTLVNSFRLGEERTSLGALTQSTSVSSLLIELTSMVMLAEMVVAALNIRKLRREIKQKEVSGTEG